MGLWLGTVFVALGCSLAPSDRGNARPTQSDIVDADLPPKVVAARMLAQELSSTPPVLVDARRIELIDVCARRDPVECPHAGSGFRMVFRITNVDATPSTVLVILDGDGREILTQQPAQ